MMKIGAAGARHRLRAAHCADDDGTHSAPPATLSLCWDAACWPQGGAGALVVLPLVSANSYSFSVGLVMLNTILCRLG